MVLLLRCLIALMCLGPMAARAVEVVEGPRVEVTGTTATVKWKLDGPAGGTVRFGRQPGELTRSVKSPVVAVDHSVILDGLEPGARYQYSVGTARKPLKEGSFQVPPTSGPARGVPSGKPTGGPPQEPVAPGASKGPPPAGKAPPARQTWANAATLRDHFERHGADFAAVSPEDYAAQAWRFFQRAKSEGLPVKIDPEGTLRVWDPKSRAFAAYTRQGLTKTYFKPGSPDYFERQPGRLVRLKPGEGAGEP